jgi:hypothetical protein
LRQGDPCFRGADADQVSGRLAGVNGEVFDEVMATGAVVSGRTIFEPAGAHTLPELLYTTLKERSTMLARNAYRAAVGVALAAAVILVWLSLGVGVIGKDGDPANLLYVGVLAVGIIGAIIARPSHMGWHARCSRRRSLRRWSP